MFVLTSEGITRFFKFFASDELAVTRVLSLFGVFIIEEGKSLFLSGFAQKSSPIQIIQNVVNLKEFVETLLAKSFNNLKSFRDEANQVHPHSPFVNILSHFLCF